MFQTWNAVEFEIIRPRFKMLFLPMSFARKVRRRTNMGADVIRSNCRLYVVPRKWNAWDLPRLWIS